MAHEVVINLRYANRGTSGATEIPGAKRARITANLIEKVSRAGGSELADDVHVSGGNPQVVIETESSEEFATALQQLGQYQTLVLGYRAPSGNRKYTVKYAKLNSYGEKVLPEAEQQGNVPTYQLTYRIVRGTAGDVADLADAIVEAADT